MELLQELNAAVEREIAAMRGPKLAPIVQTPLIKNVLKIKAAADSVRKELTYAKLDRHERSALDTEIKEAARADLADQLAAERERMAGELAREKTAYERDREIHATKYEREAQRAALRYKAMSKRELEAEAQEIIENPRALAPEVLDSLSAELRTVDPETHAALRDAVKKDQLYEPYRYSEGGRHILNYDKALAQCQATGFDSVPVPREDGAITYENLFAIMGEI